MPKNRVNTTEKPETLEDLYILDPSYEEDILDYYRIAPNATDQEILDLIWEERSFSDVGADTQAGLNRPQRNQNPGNVKRGGVADQFAKKDSQGRPITDDQGHLVFDSAEAGLQGLKADVKAKIEGRSRHVKANPTIRELGGVFAEDPNWPISVARLLGVSPDTATSTVNFNNLINAIARQEGFFA